MRYRNLQYIEIDCSFPLIIINKKIVMSLPTFVDLQGFIVDETFVVKEFAVLKEEYVLSHYIFGSAVLWDLLTKSENSCAS